MTHPAHAPHRECKRKNDVEAEALTRLAATHGVTNPDGSVTWKGSNFSWAYDASRVLVITITPSLTGAQRNQLQTAVDSRFGAGRVLIT